MPDFEKRRGDTQPHSESVRETPIGFYFARSAASRTPSELECDASSHRFHHVKSVTLLECAAGRYTALEPLKRVTEPFDLRAKPCLDEMAKFIIIVLRIMFAGGAVVLG
jgi:hypothetical protein